MEIQINTYKQNIRATGLQIHVVYTCTDTLMSTQRPTSMIYTQFQLFEDILWLATVRQHCSCLHQTLSVLLHSSNQRGKPSLQCSDSCIFYALASAQHFECS